MFHFSQIRGGDTGPGVLDALRDSRQIDRQTPGGRGLLGQDKRVERSVWMVRAVGTIKTLQENNDHRLNPQSTLLFVASSTHNLYIYLCIATYIYASSKALCPIRRDEYIMHGAVMLLYCPYPHPAVSLWPLQRMRD